MRTYLTKTRALLLLGFFSLMSCFFWMAGTELIAYSQLNSTYSYDVTTLRKVRQFLSDSYNLRGRCFTSLPEYERSEYYALSESLSPTCHGGKISVTQVNSGQHSYLLVQLTQLPIVKTEETEKNLNLRIPLKLSAAQVTKLRTQVYLAGTGSQIDWLREKQVDFEFFYDRSPLSKKPCAYPRRSFTLEPFAKNYPQNAIEVKLYVQWLQKIEGLEQLVDGWGNELHFSLNQKRLVCRSAGTDGLFNTKDDITMEAPSS